MDVFQWDDNFRTGLEEVDLQHRHLVEVTNQFGMLLSQDEVDGAALENVYTQLVSYTEYHFEEEEKVMAMAAVDDRYMRRHKQEHEGFLSDISLMHEEMKLGKETARDLFDFLMNWLVYHILGSDRALGNQIRAINSGLSAVAAYDQEEQSVDKATGLLLGALNNLFSQVSSRSKQLRELNLTLESKVVERTRALSDANRQLGELALTDALTGLANRRHALQVLDNLWFDSGNFPRDISCMMIDADGFKAINDNYGHDAGDSVLCQLARTIEHAVRNDDTVCRLGGDEFLVIFPQTDHQGALSIARKTQAEVARLQFKVADGVWSGSISVGVATRSDAMQEPKDLLKIADQGVYAAKKSGKNCVSSVQ